MPSVYNYAFKSKVLDEALNRLTLSQFFRENKIPITDEYAIAAHLENEILNNAALLASVLASSKNDKHKQKAVAFAVLLYLESKKYASYCYLILSRTGIIQQGKHLSNLFDENGRFLVKYDEVLAAELSARRALSVLNIDETKPVYMNDFQKGVWNKLGINKRIMGISGPTSAGKSYVIQSHIFDLALHNPNFRVVYVVPTRALISEVSGELRKRLSHLQVLVRVAAGEIIEGANREVLVLTPERCLQLLRDKEGNRKIDFIFIDEIQKIEDPERGILLEHVLLELLKSQKNAKFVIAGPYLRNLNVTIEELTHLKGPAIETELSPVHQLKAVFSIPSRKNDRIGVILKIDRKKNIPEKITIERSSDYKIKRQGDILADIINKYALDSNNIIYAPTRAMAENIALALAKHSTPPIEEGKKEALADLIEYLSKEIHPECSLVRCLKNGVAFHHGMIPEMAKLEIEELYRKENIKNLACTTTLLEGVNLPADRMFICRPWKRNKETPLTGFDFGNLTGRAGRANLRLNGSVYCLELGKEKWAEAKLDSDPMKKLVPATNKVIQGENQAELLENLEKKSTQISFDRVHPSTVFTLVYLRQKGYRDPKELATYLSNKHIIKEKAEEINNGILKSVSTLKIPSDIVRLNPTIDPMLQDILYKKMKDDIDNWIIDKAPKGKGEKFGEYKKLSFYYQFQDITRRLDDIFLIEHLIRRKQKYKRWYRAPNFVNLTYYGITWLEQKPFNHIIKSEINKNKNVAQELDCYRKKIELKNPPERVPELMELKRLKVMDKVIREVVEQINDNVRFQLEKYYKLWADILNSLLDNKQKEKYARSLCIPEMLELGAYKPAVITMIRAGITRSAAIEAGEILEKTDPNFNGDVIEWLKTHTNLLDPIFQKHLKRVGFITA